MIPLILLRHLVLWPNTLIEIDDCPFLSIEQPGISILPLLQKVGDRLPDEFIIALWNHGDYTVTLKNKTTLGYVREADYREKPTSAHQSNTTEVTEILLEKLPPMPEISTLMFHYTFYPKPKIDYQDIEISKKCNRNYRLL